MGKLLFFTKMNFGEAANGGIKNKVEAQKRAFESLGLEVDFLYVSNGSVIIESGHEKYEFEAKSKFAFLKYLFGGFLKAGFVRRYDYVYIRHFLTNPLFINLLGKFKKQNSVIKIFMEIPTFPYQFEFAKFSLLKRLSLKIDLFTANFFKKYISQIVTFSSKASIYGIPTIKTDNGIDVEKFGLIDPPASFNGKEILLLGLANMQVWHGLDRVLNGIVSFNQQNAAVKIHFHVVGKGDELPRLQQMAIDLNISESVTFHGFLSGLDLEKMFETCHIGIGSLGMHRINAAKGETSALKSREFMSRGMPFVIAYEDRGIPQNFPFVLNVPANENPIDLQEVIRFYNKVIGLNNFNKTMNKYAQDNFTWVAKLKPVVNYFLTK